MCGRFTLMIQPDQLQMSFDLGNVPEGLQPRNNITPGTGIPVVVDSNTRDVEIFYWGLIPSWAKDITIGRRLFNARSETLHEKASFKNAFLRRRCLIPASGFYEWQKTSDRKIPWYFHLKSDEAFMFAGLWEYWCDSDANEVYSATIITCPPNSMVSRIHNRMPVIFTKDSCWKWMEDRSLAEIGKLMTPLDSGLMTAELAQI